jgi:thiol:disulfide interchange protein DsbA
MARKKKPDKVARIRYGIIGTVVVIAAIVAGYGFLYSSGVAEGEFVAGEHYQVLEDPARRRPGAPIQVQEFFSYGCVHCRNFDPLIEDWRASAPEDVEFERVPVAFSPPWVLLARTYYALEELYILEANHDRVFRRIHDNGLMFQTPEDVAEFIDGHGATAEEFLAAMNSQTVRRRLRESDAAQRSVGIASVPTLVVAGKYVVSMDVGRKVALDVVDHLIGLERQPVSTAQPG